MTASVLVVDGSNGQARSAVAAVRALAQGGFRPVVAAATRCSLAAASRYTGGVVPLPPMIDDAWVQVVQEELQDGRYLGVLAASDIGMLSLGCPGAEFLDKRALADRAAAAGMAVPPTEVFDDVGALVRDANRFEYPMVVKPAISAWPTRRLDRRDDLAALEARGPILVQPYLTAPMRSFAGVLWRGELLAAVQQRYLRTWPPQCGTAAAAETVEVDEELAARVTQLLAGYEGIFQVQFAGEMVLDVNPRIYGSLPLAVAAGANLPSLWARLVSGESIRPVRGRPGAFYRWLEGDARHFAWAVRTRGASLGALAPRRRTAHSVESIADARPLLRRLRHATGLCRERH